MPRPWPLVLALSLVACAGSPVVQMSGHAVDRLDGARSCRVSSDGFIWYRVPQGTFAPLDVAQAACPGGTLGVVTAPVPSWALPRGRTQALFAAVSLVGSPRHGEYGPVAPLAVTAHDAGVPVTWLLDRGWRSSDEAAYEAFHAAGDDVQVVPGLTAIARATWSWYRPVIAPLGAGIERDIDGARSAGDRAFWGITWNSSGVDRTFDRGAPWGLYCADPRSYKRPSPNGDCSFAGIEWTARDLTAAYLTSGEDAYSTDPDDLLLRAALDPATAATYERQIVDAYAAAGESTPLLMVAHEEATEFANAAAVDRPIMEALYREARADGMTTTTLSAAVTRLAPVAANPRVIAFPALPLSGRFGPATIDAHDAHVGLTFLAGETMPSRVFAYDRATTSAFNVPVKQLTAAEMPALVGVSAHAGVLTLRLRAQIATRFGVAFWSDPALAGWTSPNVIPAGHAGAVAFFDLVAGDNTITLGCRACTSTTFTYST